MRATIVSATPAASHASRGRAVVCKASSSSCSRRGLLGGAAVLSSGLLLPCGGASAAAEVSSAYDFTLPQYGADVSLGDRYRGKAIVMFGGQAPGTDEEEREAAYRKFKTRDFEVYDHVLVNGPDTCPLYRFLKSTLPADVPGSQRRMPGAEAGAISWNYTMFLIGRDGRPLQRYKPGFDPLDFEGDLRLALAGLPPRREECLMHPGRTGCSVDKLIREHAA